MGLALLGRARGDAGADLYAQVRCLDLCPASVGDYCESRLGRDSDGSSDASIAGLSTEATKKEPGLPDQRTSSLAWKGKGVDVLDTSEIVSESVDCVRHDVVRVLWFQ